MFLNYVTPDYLSSMSTQIIGGRDFNTADTATSPKVAIINETAAKKFYPGKNPIGLTYRTRAPGTEWYPVEIIGIAQDAKYRNLRDAVPHRPRISVSTERTCRFGRRVCSGKTAAGFAGIHLRSPMHFAGINKGHHLSRTGRLIRGFRTRSSRSA